MTVTIAVAVSAVVTAALSLDQDFHRFVTARQDNLLATGSAFAAAAAAPVAAYDREASFAALSGIGRVPHLVSAIARDETGRIVTQVGYGARLDRDPSVGNGQEPSWSDFLGSRTIGISVPILNDGSPVGRLEIVTEANDLMGGLLATLGSTLAGAAGALLVGLAVAVKMQRSITRPLNQLTGAIQRVQERHDYDLSLAVPAAVEVGVLIQGFNAMMAEIRDRDAMLVRHRDRLEVDVTDRTRDLATAKTAAEQANAAKSTFLATMSHEIRTPMNGLLVMAELLAAGDLPPKARRYADVISKSGTTLLAIINDILDFSKIEAGKIETERMPVDVREVAGTVVSLFYARANEKGLDLATTIGAEVPRTFASDPVRLQQVLSNLVNNAIKFTSSGTVSLTVTAASDTLTCVVTDTGIGIPADRLHDVFQAFSQADGSTTRRFGGTGLGLAIANRLAKAMGGNIAVSSEVGIGSIFTVSLPIEMRAADRAWPDLKARGLHSAGLSIQGEATATATMASLRECGLSCDATWEALQTEARDVIVIDAAAVARLAGQRPRATFVIGLEEPGYAQGGASTICVDAVLRRPFIEGEFRALMERIARGESIAAHEDVQTRGDTTAYRHARVLVADDSAVNREVLSEALGRFGIRPVLAEDGAEALAAAERGTFDLILMDASMPVLDGFEACRRLRAIEQRLERPRLPVIAVTAHVVGIAADGWVEAGMDGVLHKPFTMAELERLLSTWLRSLATTHSVDPARTPAAPHEAALLDTAMLDDIADLRPGTEQSFERRVFGLYLDHAPRTLARIVAALAAGDAEALAEAAHALKSMSFNIGAMRVGQLSGQIEAGARLGGLAVVSVEALQACVSLTGDLIAARLDQPHGRGDRSSGAAASEKAVA